ncbi:MAG: NAD(P)H-quinone oxidoreductase [Vicinamibacterales bacterium]
MPHQMHAIQISRPGGPEVLELVRRPVPPVGDAEVLIKVEAAGINRPDLLQRQGKYPPPPGASDVPGLEVAGHVVDVGARVERWRTGDAVCALLAGGGYAEYCAVPQEQCLPVPRSLTMQQAGAIPETFFTVWTNLFERGRLAAGEIVLVHGGASGIGTTAIQLARAFGARVFVTAGTGAKCDACERLGAERAINYRTEDFVQVMTTVTDGRGVDVVLDMVGGDYTPRNIALLATEGRLVQIAFLRSARTEVDLSLVMRRRLTITGSTLRPRPPAEKGAIAGALERQVWPLLADGRITPTIEAVFPLAKAADAHRALEAGHHVGKFVLSVA